MEFYDYLFYILDIEKQVSKRLQLQLQTSYLSLPFLLSTPF